MRFVVLASGSKGNALVVQGGGVTLLVDCGLTPKALRARLHDAGLALTDLDALLVTHGHADHVKGAGRLAGALRLRTYATRPTSRFLARGGGLVNHVPIDEGARFELGALSVHAFATPHDAPGSVGYVIDDGRARLGICTDLGTPDLDVAAALEGCDTLYLEFNHDLDMLERGPYPPALKRRVAGPRGHLSNEQAATLLRQTRTPRLRRVLLAHLSEVNNTPNLALEAARSAIDDGDVQLLVAPQHTPTRWFSIVEEAGVDGGAAPAPASTPAPAPAANRAGVRAADKPASIRYGSGGLGAQVQPATSLRTAPVRQRAVATTSIAVRRQLGLFGAPLSDVDAE